MSKNFAYNTTITDRIFDHVATNPSLATVSHSDIGPANYDLDDPGAPGLSPGFKEAAHESFRALCEFLWDADTDMGTWSGNYEDESEIFRIVDRTVRETSGGTDRRHDIIRALCRYAELHGYSVTNHPLPLPAFTRDYYEQFRTDKLQGVSPENVSPLDFVRMSGASWLSLLQRLQSANVQDGFGEQIASAIELVGNNGWEGLQITSLDLFPNLTSGQRSELLETGRTIDAVTSNRGWFLRFYERNPASARRRFEWAVMEAMIIADGDPSQAEQIVDDDRGYRLSPRD